MLVRIEDRVQLVDAAAYLVHAYFLNPFFLGCGGGCFGSGSWRRDHGLGCWERSLCCWLGVGGAACFAAGTEAVTTGLGTPVASWVEDGVLGFKAGIGTFTRGLRVPTYCINGVFGFTAGIEVGYHLISKDHLSFDGELRVEELTSSLGSYSGCYATYCLLGTPGEVNEMLGNKGYWAIIRFDLFPRTC